MKLSGMVEEEVSKNLPVSAAELRCASILISP